jgi:hypothetical protein
VVLVLFIFPTMIATENTFGPQLPVADTAAQVPVNGVAAPPATLAVTADDGMDPVGTPVSAVVIEKYS